MTILLSAVNSRFVLSSSDMRISYFNGKKYVSLDETFNKNIVFTINSLHAILSYTGIARWEYKSKTYLMYEVISDIIVDCAKTNAQFGNIALELSINISTKLSSTGLKDAPIELHIVGFHESIPYPFMVCISNCRNVKPWSKSSELEWYYEVGSFKIFFKTTECPDFMIGGSIQSIQDEEKTKIDKVVNSSCDGFNLSNLFSKQIVNCSKRTTAIGSKSVSTIIPVGGLLDFNLYDKNGNTFTGYIPRIIFPNGKALGPSTFPMEFQLFLQGYLPSDNIFFRSIFYKHCKKADRRRVFKNKKGKKIPGLMGMVMLGLLGKLPEGYSNFIDE